MSHIRALSKEDVWGDKMTEKGAFTLTLTVVFSKQFPLCCRHDLNPNFYR